MKRNCFKFLTIFVILFLITGFSTCVKALTTSTYTTAPTSYSNEYLAESTVVNFLDSIKYKSIYTINSIDSNNHELYNQARDRLQSFEDVKYEVKKVSKISPNGDKFKVEIKFSAEGVNWEIGGEKSYFIVESVNGSYKITETDFFDKTSTEYIANLAIRIIFIAFGIVGLILGSIIITVVVIVIVVVKNNKKK